MSLINSTLRDLDKRREKESVKKRSFLTEVLLSAGKNKKFKIPGFIQFGIIMSLMVMVGVVLWSQYKDTFLAQYDEYISSLMDSEKIPVKPDPKPVPVLASKKQPPVQVPPVEKERDAVNAESGTEIVVATRAVPDQVKPPRAKTIVKATKPEPVPKTKKVGKVAKKIHPRTKEKRAELGIDKALRFIKKGDYKEGEKQLRRAIWLYFDSLRAREILAMLLINQGRISEAAKLLVESLDVAPYHSPFAKLYARILVNQGDTSMAIMILEQAQPDIIENPEYHSFLAALYQKLSMHERAIGKYRQVLSIRPDVGAWWLGLAISLEGKGRITDAIAAYRTARKSSNLNDNIIAYINNRLNILSES
ncbi:MAG: tetratricopeptide repeat protein [Gammaproteobacteria bacterium]|nr:tetratricopeptide repeat protein [Gammaproteobacteria bacterium]MCK5091275.1 tetratricopeptide repeat protein [Gammaproteobacteria bacterium]